MKGLGFSANLGFLWADLPLPDAIRAAARAGFAAVECHWPYVHDPADVRAALEETGLRMVSLNTDPGDRAAGDFGLAAVAGREAEARRAIDEAVDYARAIDAEAVHVMAGRAEGDYARGLFVEALAHACYRAIGRTVLIEPINRQDVPGYFLHRVEDALSLLADVGAPNLKIMFDFYHVQRSQGDVTRRFHEALPHIGHVQIAAVPDRGVPDHGELSYDHVFRVLGGSGYSGLVGAEFRPDGRPEQALRRMRRLQRGVAAKGSAG